MFKRRGAMFLVTIALMVFASACSTSSSVSPREKGLEMIHTMEELANDEAYMSVVGVSEEILETVKIITSQDFSEPIEVYEIIGIQDALMGFMASEVELNEITGELIGSRLVSSLPSQINARNGVETIAATSILLHSEAFIMDDIDAPTAYVYVYDGMYSATVIFLPFEDDVVYATSSFISLGDDGNAIEDIEAMLSMFDMIEFGDSNIEVKIVE